MEEKVKIILQEARGGLMAHAVREPINYKEFWAFYKSISSVLKQYATELKSEEVTRLVRLYNRNKDEMDCYQKRHVSFFDFFATDDDFRHYAESEEYVLIWRDIYNNITNLIQQVKINEPAGS